MRRGAGSVADSSGGAALDPEDGVAVGGFEEEVQVGADVGGAAAQAGRFFDVLEASSSPSRRVRALRTLSVVVAALFEEGFAVSEGHAAGMPAVSIGESRRRTCGRALRGWRRRSRWRRCWRAWP